VLPRLGTVNVGRLRRWLSQAARPDERSRRARRRLAALEVEFHGLRSFRAGDSPRWIHWRTSARRGELMVREFDHGTHHDLVVLVEPYAEADSSPALEAAVSMAATICWAWAQESGDRVVLGVAGAPPTVAASAGGPGQAAELLAALAVVTGAPEPDLAGLERRLLDARLPPGPALLVSSRRSDHRAADMLSARLDRPVAYLDAADPPPFYQPPPAGGP
jgi:uncharacterized protein (DUF58 family)